jgi:mono/diheme cytochrome c family protein
MTKKINILMAACAVIFAASGIHSTLRAQARSVADGVYTEAQAERGSMLYAEQCGSCHGEALAGIADLFPALTGDPFVMNWQGKSVGELFEKISTTMPALDPGSLKPEQVADIVAHILSVSKYPAGTTELETGVEPLKQIKIDAPKK